MVVLAPFALLSRVLRVLISVERTSPDAVYTLKHVTVKSGLDRDVVLVRRHFVRQGGFWKRIQQSGFGLFFG
jgi:hypothetical protein